MSDKAKPKTLVQVLCEIARAQPQRVVQIDFDPDGVLKLTFAPDKKR